MKRFGLSIMFVLAATVGVTAQTIDRVKILDFGIYTRDLVGSDSMPNAATGRLHIATGFKLVQQTDTVVARRGMSFGVRYQTLGKPNGTTVKLTWVTRFPDKGLADPKGARFYTNEFARDHVIGNESFRTYSFDEPWEIVPGEWVFEFWDGPRKVGEQRFNVVKP